MSRLGGARVYWSAVVAVGVLAVCLRFFDLTGQSLWYDEGYSLVYSGGSGLGENLARIANADGSERYQPAYFVLLHGWQSLFGDSEFSVRSLSAVCGALALAAVFLAARKMYGSKHALWSALLLAVSSFGVYYSQEVRPYAFLILMVAVQLWLFIRAREALAGDGSQAWEWLFWASAGAGSFSSVFVGLFSGALCLAHLATTGNRRQWLGLWLPAALAMIPAAVLYAGLAASVPARESISTRGQPVFLNAAYVVYGLMVGTTYGPSVDELRADSKYQALLHYAPHLIVLGLACVSLLVALVTNYVRQPKDRPDRKEDAFLGWLLVGSFVLATGFALVTKLNWLPRHAFFLLPVLVILLPRAALGGAAPVYARWMGFCGLATLLALNLLSVRNYYFDPKHARDDYRGAAEYVRASADAQTTPILLWGNPHLFSYYGARVVDGREIRKTRLAQEVSERSNNSPYVLLLVNRWFYWDADPEAVQKHMAPGYRLIGRVALKQFDIYRVARENPSTTGNPRRAQLRGPPGHLPGGDGTVRPALTGGRRAGD